MAESHEVWESTLGGEKSYGAYGPRDVLMIVSNELENEDMVPRREGTLTQEDKDRLSSEGIPPECWYDDAKLMEMRYLKSERFWSLSVEDDSSVKREHVISRITAFFNITTKPGGMFTVIYAMDLLKNAM